MPRGLAALLLLLCVQAAQAAQFHLPLHAPPRVWPEGKASLLMGGGYFGAGARGLHVDGPGGGWEVGAPMGERLSGHVQALGTAFTGTLDPLGSRSRKTGGMAGALEADLAFAPGGAQGSWRLYAGAQLGLTVLSLSDSGPAFKNGRLVVEPDTALSLTFGLPGGVEARREWGEWRGSAAAYLTLSPGGTTFFTFLVAGPAGMRSSERIDPFAALGTRLRLERPAWRLGLEAGLSESAPSGNNEAVTAAYGALMVRLF
ncbi:MAG: hypothetical protein HY928_07090 [Elusimicrobia bacterium]|nr:hypothetical protein [Elusimicrobiota bacterium]